MNQGSHFTMIALASALTLAGCEQSFTLTNYANAARAAGVRCLAVEPDLVVSSPFGPGYTHSLLKDVRTSRAAIEKLFEVQVPSTLRVRFVAVEMPNLEMVQREDGSFDLRGFKMPSVHGVRGFAGGSNDTPEMTIYVVPETTATDGDGRKQRAFLQLENDSLIRHEMAHVCAHLAGLEGATWFDEGVAEEIEHREYDEAGALVPTPLPRSLRLARDRHDPFSIDDLLDWKEDVGGVISGEEQGFRLGRPLAHSLVRFLLERTPGPSFREKLERIDAMKPEEIRALGPAWKAWLNVLRHGK